MIEIHDTKYIWVISGAKWNMEVYWVNLSGGSSGSPGPGGEEIWV